MQISLPELLTDIIPLPLFQWEKIIPLETQSQVNTKVSPSDTVSQKGRAKRNSESLITSTTQTPIAAQRTRKPQTSSSIKGRPTFITCKGNITIINSVVTSKGKLPREAENKFVQGTVKEPEDKGLEPIVDCRTLREIILTLPFTFQFKKNLKPEDWRDMDQVLHLHQLLKDLFQWRMDNKRFNLASRREEL
ncbi:hypothetical protein O181_069718 [Austropuccinia psidii MF-1]|uniref:Uncharacterized protein n=1 Tax=Austropuccinia psidii MF-1 TaxID=1389203 RepID=A0A9Q3I6L7_9BASI|nr:hypothetical protein [Austropuccinia psidii MF-1]